MITLVGCGFLGSICAEELAKRMMATQMEVPMVLCDGDEPERRNCANQNFRPNHIGRGTKADIMADVVSFYGPPVRSYGRVTEENIDQILDGSILIIDAVDNMETRNLLWFWGQAKGVPVLHLGASQAGTGNIEWSVHEEYESWTLSPLSLRGKPAPPDPEVHLLPCELVAYRGLGLNVGIAGAKAAGIFLGIDPEKESGMDPLEPGRILTTWTATTRGHQLQERHTLPEGED